MLLPAFYNIILNESIIYLLSLLFLRDDNRKGDHENQGYDGPPGMEPDGVIESNWNEVYDKFDEMNLKEELLRGIYAYGFEKPSTIQQRAIIPCIKGHDVIAQAQSGESFLYFSFYLHVHIYNIYFHTVCLNTRGILSMKIFLWYPKQRNFYLLFKCSIQI